MRAYILLAILALSQAGCHKYAGPTTAEGQVVDRHTGQPVGNARVQLVGTPSGGSGGGSNASTSVTADGQGNFSLSFEASESQNYTLMAYTASGYASDYGDCPYLTAGSKNTGVRVKTAAPAWVKINCVDDPPASKIGLYTSGYNGSGDNQTIGPGNFSYVRPIGSNSPGSIYVETSDSKGNVSKSWQPVNVANFDTAKVTIHF